MISHPGINWDHKDKSINKGAMHEGWYVGCPSEHYDGLVKHCEIHPSASWYNDINDAIRAWNLRA